MQEVGDLIFRVSVSPQDTGTQRKLVTHTRSGFWPWLPLDFDLF